MGTTLGTVTDSSTYSPFGELSGYQANVGGTPLWDIQYTRDALGRITQKVETIEGVTTTTVYGYDAAGRLTDVTVDGTLAAHYDYDGNGNRLAVTRPGSGTVPGTYDAQDRLVSYGAISYTYTANGDLQTATSGGETTTYSYDVFGNLVSATLPSGTQIAYVLDGQNRRIGRKVDGTLTQAFLYADQLRPVAELDGSGTVVTRFVYGTKVNVPEYLVKGGVTYRLLTDPLGSVRLVVDTATGTIAQRLTYDEFGQITLDTNPGFQPFAFAGGLYDPATQLTRFGARDYDAFTGRWTAKDPIRFGGDSPNLYGYVLNNPVLWVDPWGLLNPTKALASGLNSINAGRLYASGALKLAAAAGLSETGVGAPAGAGLASLGVWNIYSGTAAQNRALLQWNEALQEKWSDAMLRNFLGVLPFGQQFDDPCEPTLWEYLQEKYEKAKDERSHLWELLKELGTLFF